MRIEVRGADRLARTFREAAGKLEDLRPEHREAAGIVAGAADTLAPRRSGRLASSIRTGATKRAGVVRAGRSSVPYAGVIHWGWPSRGIAAQPFLSTAATSTESAWVAVYEHRVDSALDVIRGI